MTEIRGDRLKLRELRIDDVEAVHAYLSNDDVIRYMTFEETNLEHTQGYVDHAIASAAASPREMYVLGATLTSTGELIGSCNVTIRSPEDRRAMVGWVLHPDYWGRGYATEIAQLLIDFAMGSLGLHRVEALCDPANTASARVMEKVGMSREGHLRDYLLIRGEWADCLIYSVLSSSAHTSSRPSD